MKKVLRKSILCAAVFTMVFSTAYMAFAKDAWEAHPPIHVKNNSTKSPVGYIPSQIKKAYGLDKITNTGAGQTIAIVDAYGNPNIPSDLAVFSKQFGLSPANLTIAYPTGRPVRTDGGWALETSLDVEWAHAIAPDANILLCVAKTASTSDLMAAVDYATSHGAQVVSNSWGGSEFSGESSYDSHFQHNGTVYVASTGDNGAGMSWPAASPYVLAVGGTTLKIDSTGTYQGESGWSGSGGGTSAYLSEPGYQINFNSVLNAKRGVPDVAWDADPSSGVAVYCTTRYSGKTGWFQIGGTSFGAPCWAALIALSDQNRSTKLSSLNTITQLYNAAGTTGSSGYTANYNDIIQGSNGSYNAVAGYDLVTGIGSPKVDSIIDYLTNAQ